MCKKKHHFTLLYILLYYHFTFMWETVFYGNLLRFFYNTHLLLYFFRVLGIWLIFFDLCYYVWHIKVL